MKSVFFCYSGFAALFLFCLRLRIHFYYFSMIHPCFAASSRRVPLARVRRSVDLPPVLLQREHVVPAVAEAAPDQDAGHESAVRQRLCELRPLEVLRKEVAHQQSDEPAELYALLRATQRAGGHASVRPGGHHSQLRQRRRHVDERH